jgi:uncharacterized protein (DUF433 family)
MTTVMDGHIEVDEKGVARVGKTRMEITQLIPAMRVNGLTAEQAAEGYPLTVADVHAALAYYHDHRADVDAQIREIDERVDQFFAAHPNHITRAELERRRAARGGAA